MKQTETMMETELQRLLKYLDLIAPILVVVAFGGACLAPIGFGIFGEPVGDVGFQLHQYRWDLFALSVLSTILLAIRRWLTTLPR